MDRTNLHAESREWLDAVEAAYDFEPHEQPLLEAAAAALSNACRARDQLDRDGLTVEDRFGQLKAHPAEAQHRAYLLSFQKCLAQLALEDEPMSGQDQLANALRLARR